MLFCNFESTILDTCQCVCQSTDEFPDSFIGGGICVFVVGLLSEEVRNGIL